MTQLTHATDRRFHRASPTGPITMPCRVCFEAIELTPDHVEVTDLYVFYRCQVCGGSFPIRREDVPK